MFAVEFVPLPSWIALVAVAFAPLPAAKPPYEFDILVVLLAILLKLVSNVEKSVGSTSFDQDVHELEFFPLLTYTPS